MVSKPDGPSKVAIKIPSNFLTPGQQAEQAYFLHTLVTCLLPRAEVIDPASHYHRFNRLILKLLKISVSELRLDNI